MQVFTLERDSQRQSNVAEMHFVIACHHFDIIWIEKHLLL